MRKILLLVALFALIPAAFAQTQTPVYRVKSSNAANDGDLANQTRFAMPSGATFEFETGSIIVLPASVAQTIMDAALGTTRGSIAYRGASGWTALAPGTSGYALVSNGAGADPSYAAIASSGGDLTEVQAGYALDVTNGTGPIPSLALDLTEILGSVTFGDASTDTIVWTWNRATGTDPTLTFGDAAITLNGTFNATTVSATTLSGAGGGITLTASGFNGNLATTDNTLQEVAQKVDDLIIGGSQNTFTTYSVSGQSSVVADSPTDELTIVAGTGITITTNATTDTVTITNSGGATDLTAIHTDGVGEVNGLTDKATPTVSDVLMIEDAAASFGKKDITIGALEATLEGVMDLQDMQGAVTDAQVPNTITVNLATSSSAVEVADTTDSTAYIAILESQAGTLAVKSDTGITYNATTGVLTATGFSGPLTGNVTGDVSGNAGTATLATTATTANAGDSATSFFSAGQIERARGGTGADTSAYGNGIVGSDVSNNTIDIDTIAEVETAIGGTNIIVSTEVDTSAEVAAIVGDETGSGALVFATSPTLVTPVLGTPSSATLTNATGLPVSTGISGLGTGVATFLATPSTANLASAVTGETGSGALVFATSPTLVTPILGTPTSATLTNATGLPISTGVSGLGTGVATALATPSSANLASAITDETGSGAAVFGTSPTIASPTITGAITQTNAVDVVAGTTMPALAIDFTKRLNTKSVSTDSTFTYSGAVAGVRTDVRIANTDTAAHTMTIPSTYSELLGNRTTFVIPASAEVTIQLEYTGSAYRIYGDPVRIIDLTTATPDSANDYVEFHDATDGISKKALWPSAGTGTVTATGGSLTANAVVLGAGTTDTKVLTGITTDGASQLQLGVAGASVGALQLRNATSGTWTLTPPTGAMGTIAIVGPAASGTIATISDVAVAGSWNGVTNDAPTKNALHDYVVVGDPDLDGKPSVLDVAAGLPVTDASGNVTLSGTSTAVLVGTIELGHASDTTLARSSAGNVTIENNVIYRAGGTDVAVADGGTGLSAGTSGGIPYFSGATTIASTAALAANQLLVGGGAGAAPFTITTGTGVVTALNTNVGSAGAFLVNASVDTLTEWNAITQVPVDICIAASDETTAITTGTAKATFRAPYAFTITEVRLGLTTVSSSGLPTIDINEAGTTILSTKLTCDASEKTSTTAATAAVISDSAIADDAEITIDFDVAGTGATGVKVWILGYR